MIDIVSVTTGEVYKTFHDKLWFADDKTSIKRWIKKNGYVLRHIEESSSGILVLWVVEKEVENVINA